MTTIFQLLCDDGELRLETFATEDERDARLRELIKSEFEAVFDTPIPPDADPWDCYEAIHEAGLWDHYYQLEDTVAPQHFTPEHAATLRMIARSQDPKAMRGALESIADQIEREATC